MTNFGSESAMWNRFTYSRTLGMSRGHLKRFTKLVISFCYFIVLKAVGFVLQAVGRPSKPRLVILYYHGIPQFCRHNFARQMRALGRRALVFPANYRGILPSGKPNVAITFDDAYDSVAENALPELAAHGFHSTIFVPVGSLGRRPEWVMEGNGVPSSEVVMSAERIATLSSPLVTLGSHSITHPHLSRMKFHDAQTEIEGSRDKLQELTKENIGLFAFPYGDHDASTVGLCRAAGYEYVFSIVPQPIKTDDSNFVRGRVKVEPFEGPLEFFLKYNGAYAWVSYFTAIKRKWRPVSVFLWNPT
jgi:peptidoglycan/xylan/chitin deacetylase (PgdA/CDA1 family)